MPNVQPLRYVLHQLIKDLSLCLAQIVSVILQREKGDRIQSHMETPRFEAGPHWWEDMLTTVPAWQLYVSSKINFSYVVR